MKIDSMDANVYVNKPTPTPTPTPTPAPIQEVKQPFQQQQKDLVEQKHDPDVQKVVDQSQKALNQITSKDLSEMKVSDKFLIEAIERANKAVLGRNTTFRFSIHQATKRISVTVLDKDTNEVIREIPPEKVLDVVAQMWDMAGLFVDEKR